MNDMQLALAKELTAQRLAEATTHHSRRAVRRIGRRA